MYDYIFCGGGLSSLLLLNEMKDQLKHKKALVIENSEYKNESYLSYWSDTQTIFDDYRIATWNRVKCSGKQAESTLPYTVGLIKKKELLKSLRDSLSDCPIVWSKQKVKSIKSTKDFCTVYTEKGSEKASIVFDSCIDVKPFYPEHKNSIVLSGYELIIEADKEIFDDNIANFYIQTPKVGSFGYMLPISKTTALLESANFQPKVEDNNKKLLLEYLEKTYPNASFKIKHEQLGIIPLGFPPAKTTGPRHILIGQKRGLVKISAGYGIMNILSESKKIASCLAKGKIPESVRIQDKRYQLMDKLFLDFIHNKPHKADRLIRRSMQKRSIKTNFALIDESLGRVKLAYIMIKSLPLLF